MQSVVTGQAPITLERKYRSQRCTSHPRAIKGRKQSAVHPRATKKQPGVTSKGLKYDRLVFFLCLASYMVPGMKTIPSFFFVPGTRYHTYAIQQQNNLVPGIKI